MLSASTSMAGHCESQYDMIGALLHKPTGLAASECLRQLEISVCCSMLLHAIPVQGGEVSDTSEC